MCGVKLASGLVTYSSPNGLPGGHVLRGKKATRWTSAFAGRKLRRLPPAKPSARLRHGTVVVCSSWTRVGRLLCINTTQMSGRRSRSGHLYSSLYSRFIISTFFATSCTVAAFKPLAGFFGPPLCCPIPIAAVHRRYFGIYLCTYIQAWTLV